MTGHVDGMPSSVIRGAVIGSSLMTLLCKWYDYLVTYQPSYIVAAAMTGGLIGLTNYLVTVNLKTDQVRDAYVDDTFDIKSLN